MTWDNFTHWSLWSASHMKCLGVIPATNGTVFRAFTTHYLLFLSLQFPGWPQSSVEHAFASTLMHCGAFDNISHPHVTFSKGVTFLSLSLHRNYQHTDQLSALAWAFSLKAYRGLQMPPFYLQNRINQPLCPVSYWLSPISSWLPFIQNRWLRCF